MCNQRCCRFLPPTAFCCLALASLTMNSSAQRTPVTTYNITALGSPTAKPTNPSYIDITYIYIGAINNAGQVLFSEKSQAPGSRDHLYLFTNGTTKDLGECAEAICNWSLNNKGQVAVTYGHITRYPKHAAVWSDGRWTGLSPVRGYSYSSALCINDAGVVYGFSSSNTKIGEGPGYVQMRCTACMTSWQSGTPKALGVFPGEYDASAGDIVAATKTGHFAGAWGYKWGKTDRFQQNQAWVFRSGEFTHVGKLSDSRDSRTYPTAISEQDQVVGIAEDRFSKNPQDRLKSFFYAGKLSVLPQPSDIDRAFPLAVNTNGAIVGFGGSSKQGPSTALIWQGGIVTDLNNQISANSGWRLQMAVALNEKGQIVGVGTFNDQPRYFLLTPK